MCIVQTDRDDMSVLHIRVLSWIPLIFLARPALLRLSSIRSRGKLRRLLYLQGKLQFIIHCIRTAR